MGEPCNQQTTCILGGCFESQFTAESRKQLFESFWAMGNKTLQDQYLMGFIQKRAVKRRQTNDPNKPDKPQWTYTVGGDGIEVCRHTFMSIHGIKEGKLRIIMAMKNKSPENIAQPDMRGKSKFGLIIM